MCETTKYKVSELLPYKVSELLPYKVSELLPYKVSELLPCRMNYTPGGNPSSCVTSDMCDPLISYSSLMRIERILESHIGFDIRKICVCVYVCAYVCVCVYVHVMYTTHIRY